MKTNLPLNIFFLLSVAPLSIQASEAARPTIDFSGMSRQELVQYMQTNDSNALTPRSKKSYRDRLEREMPGLATLRQAFSPFLAGNLHSGITPEQLTQAEQAPRMMMITFIIPVAALENIQGSRQSGPTEQSTPDQASGEQQDQSGLAARLSQICRQQ